MKQKILVTILIITFFAPLPANANADSKRVSGLAALAILEGLAVVLSYGAAEDPNMVGTIGVFVPPYFILGSHPPPDKEWSPNWDWRIVPFLGSILTAGIYNLNVDEDDYSKSEVFKTNFSVLSAGILASYLLIKPTHNELKNEKPEESPDIGLYFEPGKVAASVTFHF